MGSVKLILTNVRHVNLYAGHWSQVNLFEIIHNCMGLHIRTCPEKAKSYLVSGLLERVLCMYGDHLPDFHH